MNGVVAENTYAQESLYVDSTLLFSTAAPKARVAVTHANIPCIRTNVYIYFKKKKS